MTGNIIGAPDPHATFEEKKSPEYGVKVGRYISGEWFGGGIYTDGLTCKYTTRRNYIRQNRLFIRGEHDIQLVKNLETRGPEELSMQNLNWQNVNWSGKYCRLVANTILEENYRLDIRACDPITVNMKKKKVEQMKKNMIQQPFLQAATQELGVDVMPKGYVPQDEEELTLWAELEDKPKIEIAEELLINSIKKMNDWDFIERQTKWDLVCGGIVAARVETDKNNGIVTRYADPERIVHSYVRRNDFKDLYYVGELETITLSDLRREAHNELSETKLREIAKTYSGKNSTSSLSTNFAYCSFDELLDYKVDVLRFVWKTSKEIVFKTKLKDGKPIKVSKKNEAVGSVAKEDFAFNKKVLDTWIEGTYIIGTNHVYSYKECENLERDQMNKALCPYIIMASDIYENRLRSFLDNIRPIVEEMQGIFIQLQKLRKRLRPDGVDFNINMLAELDDGKGGIDQSKFKQVLATFFTEGATFSKTVDLGEMGVQKQQAVSVNASAQGSAIGVLLNQFAFLANQIRETTGLNPYTDGTMANDALVGVTERAQMSASTSVKHIADTAVAFNKKVCEVISTRLGGIYKNKEAEHIRNLYNNIIGKELLDGLDAVADRHLHEFGFTYEMYPTSKEIQEFKESLNVGLQNGELDPEVKVIAENIARTSIKTANRYLLFSRKLREKRKTEQQMMLAKDKSQNDAAAAQAKVEADTQAYSMKKEADLTYAAKLAEIDINKAIKLKEIEAPYEELKFQREMQVEGLRAGAIIEKNEHSEEQKNKRSEKEATYQSEITDQKNNNTGPKDFRETEYFELGED